MALLEQSFKNPALLTECRIFINSFFIAQKEKKIFLPSPIIKCRTKKENIDFSILSVSISYTYII